MRRIASTVLALVLSIAAFAQSGVKWENISFKEAVEKAAKKEGGKEHIFLYLGIDIPYDTEWLEYFSTEMAGDFFNDKFICIMADASTPEGLKLAVSLKVKTYPMFFNIDSKGEIVYRYIAPPNIQNLIIRVDKNLEKLDSVKTFKYKYRATKDTAIAYEYLRNAAIAEDPNAIGFFVSEFFKDLIVSPNFWNVYKNTLTIEFMSMIDWTMEWRNSFKRAAPIEQIEADIADVIIKDLAKYACGNLWGNEVTINDACKYFQQLKQPAKLDIYIMTFALARATENYIAVRQLCSKQSLTRYLTTEEIKFVKEMFQTLEGINQKEKAIYINIFDSLLQQTS